MIHLGLRGTKADLPWSIQPALKSGLDIAPNPKLSPRFGKSTRSRLFQLSMSSGAGRTMLARCAGLDVQKFSEQGRVKKRLSRDWKEQRFVPSSPAHAM
jgi:hypothetical protein